MTLHNEIINIQTDLMDPYIRAEHSYKLGHRDARHQAAELSLKYERYIECLEDQLDVDVLDFWKKECGL